MPLRRLIRAGNDINGIVMIIVSVFVAPAVVKIIQQDFTCAFDSEVFYSVGFQSFRIFERI